MGNKDERSRTRLDVTMDLVARWNVAGDHDAFFAELSRIAAIIPYDRCVLHATHADERETWISERGQRFARVAMDAVDGALRSRLLDATRRTEPWIAAGPSSLLCAPLRHERCETAGCIVFASDVAYRLADRELAALVAPFLAGTLDRLRRARAREVESACKDAFLAMLGHDLRSPLTALSATLSLVRLSTDADRWAVDLMDRQVAHMTRMAEDVCEVARIARGKLALDLAPIEVSAAVAAGVEAARRELGEREQHIAVDAPAMGLTVLADRTRLGQVIAKLVTSASRRSPHGAALSLRARRDEDRVEIVVRGDVRASRPALPDDGGSFAQAAAESTSTALDLALRLAADIVKLHGGTTRAACDADGAPLVIVSLPRTRLSSAEHAVPSAADIAAVLHQHADGRRALVVDDEVDVATSVGRVLEELGCTVEIAHDGDAALSKLPAFEPELVFLNIGLPRADGFEVARKVRMHRGGARATLIAMTGFGSAGDRERVRAAGFDAHLLKPVDLSSIARLLGTLPRTRAAAQAAER